MCAVGKNIILIFAVFLLILSSCKKDTLSNTDKIKGLWRMESAFIDFDSNGLDSGDDIYYVKATDTILWNFLSSGEVEYYLNSTLMNKGIWGVSISASSPTMKLLLNTDLEKGRYMYVAYYLDDRTLILYCKKEIVFQSSIYYEWRGYKIIKVDE
jgi:hypothetical protein